MSATYGISNPFRVATIGMDDRMRELMKMAFQGPGKGSCMLSGIENADVFLFNMDHVDGSALWDKIHGEYPKKPAIVISLKDPMLTDAIFLEKPLRIEKLLEVINSMKSKASLRVQENGNAADNDIQQQPDKFAALADNLDSANDDDREYCGTNHDVDLSNAAAVANIYYKTDDYLQEQIFHACQLSKTEKVAIQIAVKVNDKWELITFLPNLQGVFTTLSDFQLRVICTAPKYCTETRVHRYSSEETSILENGPKTKVSIQAREPFLWKVALWTSRGRIPNGTSLSTPVRLRRWPNLTRLHTTPNCMRIATLLIDEARPLRVVAKVLNIPQRHVFAFYTASHALGLVNAAGEASANASATPGQKHKEHSLLSRILKRLTGAITK